MSVVTGQRGSMQMEQLSSGVMEEEEEKEEEEEEDEEETASCWCWVSLTGSGCLRLLAY